MRHLLAILLAALAGFLGGIVGARIQLVDQALQSKITSLEAPFITAESIQLKSPSDDSLCTLDSKGLSCRSGTSSVELGSAPPVLYLSNQAESKSQILLTTRVLRGIRDSQSDGVNASVIALDSRIMHEPATLDPVEILAEFYAFGIMDVVGE